MSEVREICVGTSCGWQYPAYMSFRFRQQCEVTSGAVILRPCLLRTSNQTYSQTTSDVHEPSRHIPASSIKLLFTLKRERKKPIYHPGVQPPGPLRSLVLECVLSCMPDLPWELIQYAIEHSDPLLPCHAVLSDVIAWTVVAGDLPRCGRRVLRGMRNSWIGIEMKIEDKEAPEAPWETPSRGDSVKGRSGRNSRDAELPIADSKASQPVAYSIHAQIACAGDLTRPNPRSISGGPPALEGTWLAPTSFPDLSSDHSKIRKCSIAGSLSS